MFYKCSSITSLNLSGFDTSNVTNMSGMFQKCSSITTLDLSSFNTENVTTMSNMFNGCSALTRLDISGFYTAYSPNVDYMFTSCTALTTLICTKNTLIDFVTSSRSGLTDTNNIRNTVTGGSIVRTWTISNLNVTSVI